MSEEWLSLRLACPAIGCANKNQAYQWTHADRNCGGYMSISTELNLRCNSCWTKSLIQNWCFSCSYHPGRFIGTSNDEFVNALSVAMKLYAELGTSEEKRIARRMADKAMAGW